MNNGMTTQPNNSQPPDIKELLRSQGRTMGFAAKTLGISRNSMSDIAKRKSLPRLDRALKLSQLTGLPLQDLYPEYLNS